MIAELLACLLHQEAFWKLVQDDLATRLLSVPREDLDATISAERLWLAPIQKEDASDFAVTLELMLSDLESSRSTVARYNDTLDTSQSRSLMSPLVIRARRWGIMQRLDESSIQLPEQLKPHIAKFESFYKELHECRKLQWSWSHGTARIRVNTAEGECELVVTSHQMLVLLHFNDSPSLSAEDVVSRCGLSQEVISRCLTELSSTPTCLLRIIHDSGVERFEPNPEYRPSATSLSTATNLDVLSMTTENDTSHGEQAANSCQSSPSNMHPFMVLAATMRVMKRLKRSRITKLFKEIRSETRDFFTPPNALLKRQLDVLLDKGFLERSEDDM